MRQIRVYSGGFIVEVLCGETGAIVSSASGTKVFTALTRHQFHKWLSTMQMQQSMTRRGTRRGICLLISTMRPFSSTNSRHLPWLIWRLLQRRPMTALLPDLTNHALRSVGIRSQAEHCVFTLPSLQTAKLPSINPLKGLRCQLVTLHHPDITHRF